MEELRKYIENNYYYPCDVADKLIELSNLELSKELRQELENAIYWLKSAAQNKYDKDYFRVLYNVLLVITGMEVF